MKPGLIPDMLNPGCADERPYPVLRRRAKQRRAPKVEGVKKRSVPQDVRDPASGPDRGASRELQLFKVPFTNRLGPPPNKIPCCHRGFVPQRCLAVGSRAWAPGRDGWMEPHPQAAAADTGRKLRERGRRKQQDRGEATSASRPRAGSRCARPRLDKLYAKGALLGKGGYGSVYAGTRKSDGLPVAIKYVSKAQAEAELDIPGQDGPLPLEVALMKQVALGPCCPYVVQMLDWFDQPSRYVMVLERPEPCQDLASFSQDQGGFMSESLARSIITQLLRALRHCHARGILHRDVKPENLLIQTDSHQVKLIDFGCGALLKNAVYKEFAGTLEYTPPEWFSGGQYLAGPAEVWSVGVTLFSLVCGFLPFDTIPEIIKGRVSFPRGMSAACRHLIRWCLSTRAADRPSLEQIQLHKWLT